MVAPYPAINEVGIVTALQQGFVHEILAPKPFIALAAPHQRQFGRWFHEQVKWRDVSVAQGHTVVSMRLPPVNSTQAGKHKARTVEMPFWTRSQIFEDRDFAQMQESGLEPEMYRSHAEGMLLDWNSFFANGIVQDAAKGLTADIKGMLNHGLGGAGAGLTTGGDWSDPHVLNRNLSAANTALRKRRQGDMKALVMNEGDGNVFDNFINQVTGMRISERLPTFISRVLYEADTAVVPTGTAWLIAERDGNFEALSPVDEAGMTFGLGTITAGILDNDRFVMPNEMSGTRMEEQDVMMKRTTIQWINILTMRILHDSADFGSEGSTSDRSWSQKLSFSQSA